MALNHGWYNRNQNRAYPFDDSATLVDDAGLQLPTSVLAGVKTLSDVDYGRFIYVGSLSVSPTVVSIVLMASEDLDSAGTAILAFSAVRPLNEYRQLEFSPLTTGAGGWVVFPDELGVTHYSGRFTTPRQSLLAPAAARWYATPAIPSAGAYGQPGFTGLVRLSGGNDFEIVGECLEIPGYDVPEHHPQYCGDDELGPLVRKVALFRLRDKSEAQGVNVFDKYRGACGARPESETCLGPQPVQNLGGVTPDCCGNILIDIRGCANIRPIRQLVTVDDDGDAVSSEEACGVVIDCGLGLAEACVAQSRLPDEDGRLPNEYDDLCSSVSTESVSVPEEPEESYSFNDDSATASIDDGLPAGGFGTLGDFSVRSGIFTDEDGPLLRAGSGAVRNIVTYEPSGVDVVGYYRQVAANVKMLPGSAGDLHNAAVMANYREVVGSPELHQYYVAEIDWDGYYRGFKLFRIAKFNGTRWVDLFSVAVPGLVLEDEYELRLSVSPQTNHNNAWLTARLIGIDDPGVDVQIGPLAINGYAPEDGFFGLATNRGVAEFTSFSVDNVIAPP